MSVDIVAKNLLLNRVCDNCFHSFVMDDIIGPQLHCTSEDFVQDPLVKWKSHIIPDSRTCIHWSRNE